MLYTMFTVFQLKKLSFFVFKTNYLEFSENSYPNVEYNLKRWKKSVPYSLEFGLKTNFPIPVFAVDFPKYFNF